MPLLIQKNYITTKVNEKRKKNVSIEPYHNNCYLVTQNANSFQGSINTKPVVFHQQRQTKR
jgi:hypothetical protein